jgi:putative sterol carrier protein
MKFLSQEFLDKQTELAKEVMIERPQANIVLQYVITGGPDGDVKYYQKWDQGFLVENAQGETADAEATLTSSYTDSVAVAKGELNAQQAFMTGKVRATGNMGKLMSLMPLTNSPEYKKWEEDTRALSVDY